MNQDFNMALVFAMIPVVQGSVEALKIAFLPSRLAPVVAILLGVGSVYLTRVFPDNVGMMVLTGVVVGLGAAGLYSFTKSNLENKAADKLAETNNQNTPIIGSDIGGDNKVVTPVDDETTFQ